MKTQFERVVVKLKEVRDLQDSIVRWSNSVLSDLYKTTSKTYSLQDDFTWVGFVATVDHRYGITASFVSVMPTGACPDWYVSASDGTSVSITFSAVVTGRVRLEW